MAYTPVVSDVTNPLDTVDRSTAAAEFRAMKTFLSTYSTVASATSPDIFNNTNRNINYTGSIQCTGFVAAASAGAERQLTCAANTSFLAGANLLIDGALSGTTVNISAGTILRVMAVTTTQFQISVVSGLNGVVPGTLIAFTGTVAPAGYLACPTTSTLISVASYLQLAKSIGNTWGNGSTTAAGSFTVGQSYVITALGTTDFTLIGANSNTVGGVFTATGIGSGTGTAATQIVMPWMAADYAPVQANANVGTSSVGQVIAHSHPVAVGSISSGGGTVAVGSIGVGSSTSVTGAATTTGGSANLAAGVRFLYCVKY